MGINYTDKFIDDIYVLAQQNLPKDVIGRAKKCFLDYLGVTFAGSYISNEKSRKLLDSFGSAHEQATVIGLDCKASIQTASLINGLNSHIADFDDGVRFGMMHPGTPVISALLPIAETYKVSGADFLTSMVIGYEAAIRIARAIQPSHKEHGFHATGTCGTIGAAIGIASALKFSKKEMKNSLSAAATGAAGILKMIEDGSELKPFNVGHAAQTAISAAFLGRAGFNGPDDVLSGENGFLQIMADRHDISMLERLETDPLCIERIYMKPYAACRHSHAAIEAALKIKSRYDLIPEKINKIIIKTYLWAVAKHDHTEISGITSAKMSTPYSIAVALISGKADINEFMPERITDKNVLSLAQKVEIISDDNLTSLVPAKRAAIVEIITDSNDCYKEGVDFPRGEPENPINEKDLKDKFLSLAKYAKLSEKRALEIIEMVWNVEEKMSEMFEYF